MKVVFWWKLSIDEGCILMKGVFRWKSSIDESCQLIKVVYWSKLSFDESCLLVKVIYWWKLSIDESWTSLRSDSLWRFACGDVYSHRHLRPLYPLRPLRPPCLLLLLRSFRSLQKIEKSGVPRISWDSISGCDVRSWSNFGISWPLPSLRFHCDRAITQCGWKKMKGGKVQSCKMSQIWQLYLCKNNGRWG